MSSTGGPESNAKAPFCVGPLSVCSVGLYQAILTIKLENQAHVNNGTKTRAQNLVLCGPNSDCFFFFLVPQL